MLYHDTMLYIYLHRNIGRLICGIAMMVKIPWTQCIFVMAHEATVSLFVNNSEWYSKLDPHHQDPSIVPSSFTPFSLYFISILPITFYIYSRLKICFLVNQFRSAGGDYIESIAYEKWLHDVKVSLVVKNGRVMDRGRYVHAGILCIQANQSCTVRTIRLRNWGWYMRVEDTKI